MSSACVEESRGVLVREIDCAFFLPCAPPRVWRSSRASPLPPATVLGDPARVLAVVPDTFCSAFAPTTTFDELLFVFPALFWRSSRLTAAAAVVAAVAGDDDDADASPLSFALMCAFVVCVFVLFCVVCVCFVAWLGLFSAFFAVFEFRVHG